MGRKIYLIRHGKPDTDGKRCIGLTDVPLSEEGYAQVRKACRWLKNQKIEKIYSSPLTRCRQTARIIVEEALPSPKTIHILENLREMSVGHWENLTFEEIREQYPEEYAKRGENIGYYAPPEGESFAEAGKRFGECLDSILSETEGNILIAAHAGVIRGYLCQLSGISANFVMNYPQPYAGITVLEQEEESIIIEKTGYQPPVYPDESDIEQIYQECHTPEHVIAHMIAVASFLLKIKDSMQEDRRQQYDWELLHAAALLHDIKRLEKDHAKASADYLFEKGYKEIAELVRAHHDGSMNEGDLSSDELLFYADKRVAEEKEVTIEERFERSFTKCRTPEAKEKHQRLYEKSKTIENKILKEEI